MLGEVYCDADVRLCVRLCVSVCVCQQDISNTI